MSVRCEITLKAEILEGSVWGIEDIIQGMADPDIGKEIHELLLEDPLSLLDLCSLELVVEEVAEDGEDPHRYNREVHYSAEKFLTLLLGDEIDHLQELPAKAKTGEVLKEYQEILGEKK